MKIRFKLNKGEINTFNMRNIEVKEIIEELSLDTITIEINLNNKLPLEELKVKEDREIGWRLLLR
jgi:hypothetical protein